MRLRVGILSLALIVSLFCFGCGGGGGGGGGGDGGGPGGESTYDLSGTITKSGGGALQGVTMTLSGTSSGTATTGASGNYSFTDLVNGSYTVNPSLAGYTFTPISLAVTVNGANVTAIDFTATAYMGSTYSISGNVSVNTGGALKNVTMTLSGTNTGTVATDASGDYTFSGLANGDYIVTPSLSGYIFNPVNSAQTVNGANISNANFLASVITAQYKIDDLGTFPGSFYSWAYSINNNGQVVGEAGIFTNKLGSHAFLYSSGIMTDLGTLGGGQSQAIGINDSGQVVGGSEISGNTEFHAFLYSSGTMTDLGTLGGDFSIAYDINDSGQVVGGSDHAFLYSSGTMIDLGTLGGVYSDAYGINDSGQVVGCSYIEISGNTYEHAFLYSSGTMIDLGTPPGCINSRARAINNSGQVVGDSDISDTDYCSNAFLYSGGKMIDIGNYVNPRAINSTGQVVGAARTAGGDLAAFLYSSGTMTDLNLLLPSNSGWLLRTADGINDNGQIVGWGVINGEEYAYLLTPIP
jgi:probable HAF family extracellular repeat protein